LPLASANGTDDGMPLIVWALAHAIPLLRAEALKNNQQTRVRWLKPTAIESICLKHSIKHSGSSQRQFILPEAFN
jgi:hypothetical protein